jgi:hypothetical protein
MASRECPISYRSTILAQAEMTHHSQIQLDRCRDPQRVRIPGLVPALDQTLPREICAESSGNRNDHTDTEKDAYANPLFEWHLESHDDRYWQNSGQKIRS